MARQPRLQFPGAHYLIHNKGDDGRQIFAQHDGAYLFQEALREAVRRNGWKLFAYAVLKNRYYLAIETPKGNLTDGMQWLQSAFSNRLNLHRQAAGHIFGGRYKAQLVEPSKCLLDVVDFVHASPVRIGLCDWEGIGDYEHSSFYHYARRGVMRGSLNGEAWLKHLGIFSDDPARVWPMYRNHLINVDDEAAREGVAGGKFLSGWAIGSKDFKRKMAARLREGANAKDWGGSAMREINELEWENILERCLSCLDKRGGDVVGDRKSAEWKVAVAAYLKNRTSVSNPWLGEKLNMGAPAAVSRYVGAFMRGDGAGHPIFQALHGVA